MKKITCHNTNIEISSILEGSFQSILNQDFKDSKKIIIVDENTHDFCLEFMITSFPELAEAEIMLIPNGEENKVLEVCFQIWEALRDYEISRGDLIINLGGGVITDMGGFIASVFKRGVRFINIPTSLLGMVDASYGGKTGIDMGGYKNLLGTFTDPSCIFVDPSFLSTLPEEELWNGYAEMLKHSLISDKEMWGELKGLESAEDLINDDLIFNSIKVKAAIVDLDPKENEERKLLNFGHTIGHAIEGFLIDKSPISHGHAVAIGIWLESYLSYKKNCLELNEFREIEQSILSKFSMVYLDPENFAELILFCRNDKKNSENKIKGVLIHSIGKCEFNVEFEESEIIACFNYMNSKISSLN